MAQPIYKFFMAKSSQAGYKLPPQEREKILTRMEEQFTELGCKRIILCDSGWASEQWTIWGVEEYPDIEALQKHTALINELDWLQYVDSFTLLGTKLPTES
jgi:hypothetical protein